jgi:DMSO/TMAO reductase YedYZ heme-binding membrane subunit
MSEKFAWYLSRSSGWVAFVLLAFTVMWGVLGITRLIERRGLPRWLLDVHRHLAFLSVVFTGIHLGALVADNYMQIAWREILVPFSIDYRPGAVAWGVVAMYLMVAVQLTSWLRHRIPRRWWRGVHFLSYPMLWMVTMHGLRAGTDADEPLVQFGVIGLVGAVAFLTLVRLFTVGPRRRRTDALEALESNPTASGSPAADGARTGPVDTLRPDEADHAAAQLGSRADGMRTR